MTASSKTIQDVVVKHFDEYQQQYSEGVDGGSKTRRSGVRDASVEARVKLLRKDLAPLLKKENNNDSLNDEDDVLDSPVHGVTAAVLQCVDAAMAAEISKESQHSIDAILELAACFGALEENEHLASALVARAVQFSAVIMERVRVQACKLLGICVEYLRRSEENNDAEWRDECIDVARKAIRSRLTDKSQAVRNAAICACAAFFIRDKLDENDADLLESFLWNMNHDPSAANRISALQSVGIMKDTVDAIIARVRDVKAKVRVEALNILRSKVSIQTLTSEHFAEVVRSGLTDRCKATCEAATRMVCAGWLKAVRYDPIALLGLLDPVVNEVECIKVARVILDVASEAEGTSVPEALEQLSDPEIRALKESVSNTTALLRTNSDTYLEPRAVLFARVKCDLTNESESISEAQKEKVISKIVPDIPVLCEALQMHISRLVESIQESSDNDEDQDALQDEDVFVCSQLLQMAQVTDLKEEGSRRHFISAMKTLLEAIETPDDLIEGCIKALQFAHEKESDFLQTISDLISELSSLQVDDSPSIMEEVIQLRIISILAIALEITGARMANDSTVVGFSSHIVPAVTSRHALVREGGVSCLGRLAILSDSKTVIEEFKPLLLSVASNENEKLEIRAQAMMAICDLSFLFSDMLSSCDTGEDSGNIAFVPLLSDLLRTSKPAVVGVAAEIASKLLFAGRTFDATLIADLIVTYFDQDIASLAEEEKDDAIEIGSPVRMQQLLSLFFPAYGMRNPACRAALVSSVGPMLTAVSTKLRKKGAKVSNWSMSRMVEYIESLLETSNDDGDKESSATIEQADTTNASQANEEPAMPPTQEPFYSALIAIEVSQVLLNDQSSLKTTVLRQLCKTLGSTHIDAKTTDPSVLIKLKKNMDDLEVALSDATCLRSLKPMSELLDSLDLDEDDGAQDDDAESTETEPDSDAESLAEALEAIAVAERAEKENAGELNVSVENDGESTSKVSASTPSTSRRRLASLN